MMTLNTVMEAEISGQNLTHSRGLDRDELPLGETVKRVLDYLGRTFASTKGNRMPVTKQVSGHET